MLLSFITILFTGASILFGILLNPKIVCCGSKIAVSSIIRSQSCLLFFVQMGFCKGLFQRVLWVMTRSSLEGDRSEEGVRLRETVR